MMDKYSFKTIILELGALLLVFSVYVLPWISYFVGIVLCFQAHFVMGVASIFVVPFSMLVGFLEIVTFGHCNLAHIIMLSLQTSHMGG